MQLLSTAVISRILTPTEIGVFSVAAVFASLASVFRDFGVAEYIIQEPNLTDNKIRAATTVNVAASWLMALLLVVFAPLVAEFYRDDRVATVMHIQSASFLFIPFGAITMAQFRKDLDFRPLFVSNVFSGLVSFSTTMGLALSGAGPSSLAWGSLAGVVASVVSSLYMAPKSYSWLPGFQGLSQVVRFGKFASIVYVLGQLGKSAPEMIIGYGQDLKSVAMFSRANGLVELLNRAVLNVVTPVCLPYFARDAHELIDVRRGYLLASSYISAIGLSFFAFMMIETFSVIRILYGPQWMEAIPPARILCVVGSLELIHYLAKELLVAVGEVKRAASLQACLHGARILASFAALPFGLLGVCYAILLVSLGGVMISQFYLGKTIGLTIRQVLSAHRLSIILAAGSALPVLCLSWSLPVTNDNYILHGLMAAALGLVTWTCTIRWIEHPLHNELVRALRPLFCSGKN